MAGVGMGPSRLTSAPADTRPDSSTDSSMYPETRVSLPMMMWQSPRRVNTRPTAQPRCRQNSGVMGNRPTVPRMPSVPKYFLPIR